MRLAERIGEKALGKRARDQGGGDGGAPGRALLENPWTERYVHFGVTPSVWEQVWGQTPCFGSRTVLYSSKMSYSLGEKLILDREIIVLASKTTSFLGLLTRRKQC